MRVLSVARAERSCAGVEKERVPELPDIVAYVDALSERIAGVTMVRVRVASPFLVRSIAPPIRDLEGQRVLEVRRVGKRIAFGFESGAWMVLHLMIAGRLHWRKPDAPIGGRTTLAAFDFSNGTLVLTEAGTKKRASLYVVRDEDGLRNIDPGGLDVLTADFDSFRDRLRAENHTLKRALTDPRTIDGIGNAYSDEILHAAKLSPLAQTQKLRDEEWHRLYDATRDTLQRWIERLRVESAQAFPEKVTAFRPEMAVHGRYKLACPECGSPVRRIRYADNETNYCAPCQTGGKILADRALSRLLK
jgi:formamidopyrimidine-DNA glycosylase